MSPSKDSKRLNTVLVIIAALSLLLLMLNYLKHEISREGKELRTNRILETRIVPLLQSRHFNFEISEPLVFTRNYLYGAFRYPHGLDIDFKLRQLNYHLQRYDMEGSYSFEAERQRHTYRIRSRGEQVAMFHLVEKAKNYLGKLAIVLDDFGYNYNAATQGFLAMDKVLNISIIPGHDYSRQIAADAARRGHAVMLHMPMEPFDYAGGEENYILKPGMRIPEVQRRLTSARQSVPNAVAMNNHMGSRATSDEKLMHALANVMLKEDLPFLDSYTYGGSVVEKVFRHYRLPSLKRDIFLDNVNEAEAIRTQIRQAVKIALKHGEAIAIGHDRPVTYEVLEEMLEEIDDAGVELVRITEFFPGDRR